MPFNRRCQRVQQLLADGQIGALLVTERNNRYYLSGFRGSSGYLLLTLDQVFLLTDFRYANQAQQEAAGCEIVELGKDWVVTLEQLLVANNVQRLGFEQEQVNYAEFLRLEEKLSSELVGTEGLIEGLREIKDKHEIELMRTAALISDRAFSGLLETIKPGVTEWEVAAELEYLMRRLGSAGVAFDTIIASGIRSALPHGSPSNKKIEQGDLVVIDFGATYQGYCSDMTRTLVAGKASTKQREIYHLVLRAQLAGLEGVKACRTCQEVDTISRKIIADNGYGEFFGHSLGHGVGLDIHEKPRLAQGNMSTLKEGMIVTIEPGIYLRNWGGVRIEDMVAITQNGCENLTKTSKELIEIF